MGRESQAYGFCWLLIMALDRPQDAGWLLLHGLRRLPGLRRHPQAHGLRCQGMGWDLKAWIEACSFSFCIQLVHEMLLGCMQGAMPLHL